MSNHIDPNIDPLKTLIIAVAIVSIVVLITTSSCTRDNFSFNEIYIINNDKSNVDYVHINNCNKIVGFKNQFNNETISFNSEFKNKEIIKIECVNNEIWIFTK
jgi:hypothetical protein